MDPVAFSGNFKGRPVPAVLQQLLAFENTEAGGGYYAAGFELVDSEGDGMLRTYSDDATFLQSLCMFAQADGTGSEYGLWISHPEQTTDDAPVVIFGSEGGFHVVAENLTGLLHLLAYDAEPMADHDGVSYYKDESDEGSDGHAAFVQWLASVYNISTFSDPEEIMRKAQARYAEPFKAWMKNYYAD